MKSISYFCKTSIVLAITALTFGCANTHHGDEHSFSYTEQGKWEFQSGNAQSPIAIQHNNSKTMKDNGTISLDYSPTIIDEEDNSHTIQVNSSGQAQINGRYFELLQFHFHSPSEHTLNGEYYPLEVHFVHNSQSGRLAVIGVFFTEGAANPVFEKVLGNIKPGEKNTQVESIEFTQLLPQDKSYYHYLGSLTTPPLHENVEWYIMKTPIEVSSEQITHFQKYYNGNNRTLQPINNRSVLFHQAN